MQSRLWHVARSALFNSFATMATLGVGFFLAPFVVHRLGNVAYGVWVLALSSVNYLNLLDLGLRTSVLRFVSKGHTTQNHQNASEVLSAALWVRLQIGLLVLLICGGLAVIFPHIIKVPPALALDARRAILVIGITTAINMSVGVLGGVLSALNRYDLLSSVTLIQLTLRVTGVIVVLLRGHGIVAIAGCELIAAIVANSLLLYFSRRVYPQLVIALKKPSREILRSIWSYSAYAFLLMIAGQVIYQTDNLVVGTFISAGAVTFYSIGNSLCRYTQQIMSSVTVTFTPAASSFESSGNKEGLRALYYNGTRATLAISLPIVITLLVRGSTFIGLWMGPQYSHQSGIVLIILGTALLFSLQNSPAASIAWGIEKHKAVAKWGICEAVANLSLSVFLARKYGLYGVAVGTLIPSLVVQLILWPRYISHLFAFTWSEVYLKVWGPLFLCAIPFTAASYVTERWLSTQHITTFALQTVCLAPIFFGTVALVFREEVKTWVSPRIAAVFGSRLKA